MKKLIIKTALITLASLIGLMAILFGVFALFIPKPLGDLFFNTGDYSTGMYYYEKQYKMSGSAEDLWTICQNIDLYNDTVKAEKYLTEFKNLDDFEKYCKRLDNGNALTTEEFIEGRLVCAIYKNKGIDQAVEMAKACVIKTPSTPVVNGVIENEYTEFNPFYLLASDDHFMFSANDFQKILDVIDGLIDDKMLNEVEEEYAGNDISFIEETLGIV